MSASSVSDSRVGESFGEVVDNDSVTILVTPNQFPKFWRIPLGDTGRAPTGRTTSATL